MALRRPRTYASGVTEEQTVEGGLAEPEELEPDQGSLDLALPEDRHDRSEWEAAAAAVLRKARRLTDDDADDRVWDELTQHTLDGIAITPLGVPGEPVTGTRPLRDGSWDVRSRLVGTDPAKIHESALADLEGGVTSLWLTSGADLPTVLDGVLLDLAPVIGDGTVATARAFLDHAGDGVLADGTNLGIDPATVTGDELAEVARLALDREVLAFVVDATTVHDGGASDAQELGWSMAAAASYLRAAEAAGLLVEEAAWLVEFRYAATDEQFLTIAKLRAARRLWWRVLTLSGAPQSPQRQHVVTSRPMMSRYDPYVNMLRTTVAAFAAGVGGADAVTVLPFDSPFGVPEEFGRRIARNTSHLLVDESHLAVVSDPAGGAYAVERLTDDLAAAAWAELGRIEEEGPEAFDQRVAMVVAERERQVATRSRPLTGLSEFPNLAEEPLARVPDPANEGVRSYGSSFEALRDDPPAAHVFLATMGTVAAHTARATFAANLLAAGGIAVDVAGATETADDLVTAYDGQRVVCLAGTDGAYNGWADDASRALREAGAQWVVVAGRRRESVDDSCAAGVDAVAFLQRTREALA
jgi:methylmalonyl-CoA mutase